ncbi:hypothetical protein CAL13_12675 [Bordetella genomosp. 9]|uniref:ATP-grasp domain-containing protein n=2 Tax=Bordetella genomosp. 9 TaxID=1416803 RepID=A0A1W6Z0V3_9BORD|nr:hypothetical protein CAL13_12675 [Bordetella genomosp. 9]
MTQGLIAFSGYNTRAVVAFCRHLHGSGLKAHLIARDPQDPIFLTRYAEWVATTRDSAALDLEAILALVQPIRRRHGYDSVLIIPTTEFVNRQLIAHRETLNGHSVHFPLVPKPLYETLSDKFAFRRRCEQYDISVPPELDQRTPSFPMVAKKRHYWAGSGSRAKPYLIFNETDYAAFLKAERPEDFYFERFVRGRSLYLLACVKRDGEMVAHWQENLIQQADGKSIIAAKTCDPGLHDLEKKFQQVFGDIGFYGLVMVEVRQDGDISYMIEANPRLWGPLQLVADHYPDILDAFLQICGVAPRAGLVSPKAEQGADKLYFWYGGLASDWAAGRQPVFHDRTIDITTGLPQLLNQDVFLRPDTFALFRAEVAGQTTT